MQTRSQSLKLTETHGNSIKLSRTLSNSLKLSELLKLIQAHSNLLKLIQTHSNVRAFFVRALCVHFLCSLHSGLLWLSFCRTLQIRGLTEFSVAGS